jgi:hypothetical protein
MDWRASVSNFRRHARSDAPGTGSARAALVALVLAGMPTQASPLTFVYVADPTASQHADHSTAEISITLGGNSARAGLGNHGVLGADGGYSFSAWSDGFLVTGGTGPASLAVSIGIDGIVHGASADSLYMLMRSDDVSTFTSSSMLAWAQSGMETSPGGTRLFAVETDATPDHSPRPDVTLPADTPVNATFVVMVPFVYGQSFYLASALDASGTADFLNSVAFGISAPSGATLTAASGFSYAPAVPEPGAAILLLAGIVAVFFWRRRNPVG